MIDFIVADAEGMILKVGTASSLRNAWLQKSTGQRVFTIVDPVGIIDENRLMINFNTMLISRREGVEEGQEGDGLPVTEIAKEPTS